MVDIDTHTVTATERQSMTCAMEGPYLGPGMWFSDTVTLSCMSDGLDWSAKLLLYRKGTMSRSVMLPPGHPGTLQKWDTALGTCV